jgi:hypothetical protein
MFLKKVYQEWRPFFWCLVLLMAAQAFFMFKGIQNAPFFLYQMFSTVHPLADTVKVVLIKTPGGYFNQFKLSNREAEMLLNNIDYYKKLKENHCEDFIAPTIEKRFGRRLPESLYSAVFKNLVNDRVAVEQYPYWWKKYFNSVNDKPYTQAEVVLSNIVYGNEIVNSSSDSVIFKISLR